MSVRTVVMGCAHRRLDQRVGGMERQEVMESRRQRTRTLQRVEWLKLLDIDLRLYLGRRRCAGARAGLVGVLGERGVDVQGAVIREETRREL